MEQENFFEMFYSNLSNELGDDEFVKSVKDLIDRNKLTKNNFMKLIKEEYHE